MANELEEKKNEEGPISAPPQTSGKEARSVEAKPEMARPTEVEARPEVGLPAVEKKEELKEIEAAAPKPAPAVPAATVPAKSEMTRNIERILEEDLGEVYFKMPPALQKEFRAKGEETASKIEKLLKQTRVAVRKILKLIREWLKIIPGVNKFFLEQEAKIKTDQLIKLKEKK